MFSHDASGIEPGMNFKLLPDKKWFKFRIADTEELESSKGYPMVKCICEVIDDLDYEGETVWHFVTFIPKELPGAGIPIHFLKSIGEPWEGKITVEPKNWRGKAFSGYVIVDEYKGKKNNKISQINLIEMKKSEEIPF